MNINNLYLKFEKSLGREKIDSVVNQFNYIKNQLFEDRNMELVIGSYLELELHKIKKQQQINNLNSDLLEFESRKKELLNYSINILRKENRLINWLSNLDMETVSKLNNILDIQNEFHKVDMMKFNEIKKKRGMIV